VMREERVSPLLAGLLVAVALVYLPSADAVSPQNSAAAHLGGADELMDVGEAAVQEPKQAEPEGDALKNAHAARNVRKQERAKQQTLKTIEKLLEQPIIDPRQADMYQKAAQTVQKAKQHIEKELQDVVKMQMLTQHVNEAQAKHAVGDSDGAGDWALSAGASVMSAATTGHGCQDSHPGLCAGVQVQGHCGIKEYAKSCPLSCHMCAMPAQFRMKNTHERADKEKEERAGKMAARKKKAADEEEVASAKELWHKGKAKLELAKHSVESSTKNVERIRLSRTNMQAASE